MKIAQGMIEDGTVVGNTYDKYGSRNIIVRRLMQGFESSLIQLVSQVNPRSIHEVGCGEGYWVMRWADQGIESTGSDFSGKVIELARANALERGIEPDLFSVESIYELPRREHKSDLIICCEVLEHLEHPEDALRKLQTAAQEYVIVSVPREPIWSVLNLARGKYIASGGNTPGHIQRWSASAFKTLVSRYFEIVDVRTPLPWTMLLCRVPSAFRQG
jgi:2-polyprenyl-3-methyl-5-hydroxy-6-metoxy-1,4-benzoquinol methylase